MEIEEKIKKLTTIHIIDDFNKPIKYSYISKPIDIALSNKLPIVDVFKTYEILLNKPNRIRNMENVFIDILNNMNNLCDKHKYYGNIKIDYSSLVDSFSIHKELYFLSDRMYMKNKIYDMISLIVPTRYMYHFKNEPSNYDIIENHTEYYNDRIFLFMKGNQTSDNKIFLFLSKRLPNLRKRKLNTIINNIKGTTINENDDIYYDVQTMGNPKTVKYMCYCLKIK